MIRGNYHKRVLRDIDLLKTNYEVHIEEDNKKMIHIIDYEKYYQKVL